ncbi:uncharacterized protein LOC117119178 [Anneissia japonica]|uniref:uncharacterized protein LOC117119178 n=1 Tax=Anneissia japonica TaxID=1529436 RepID=UPI001425503C|nr:uncharacterized protein LOC117119178 [Anneissia japonica]
MAPALTSTGVTCILAQSGSVRVNPATAKLGEDATFTFTPAPGEAIAVVTWSKKLDTPTLAPRKAYVNETEYAIFACLLPDVPTHIINITWIKDGDVLDVTDTEKYPQSETTLVIRGVNKMDEGDYQCRAENAAYSGYEGKLSNTGTLSVATQPELTIQQSQKREHCPGSDTDLVVGMTFLGIFIGIVLSSVVFAILLKTRTSSSKSKDHENTGPRSDL